VKVVVVGQGYVGLPLAVRAAEVGFSVVGIDLDVRRVALLASCNSFVGDIPSGRLRPLVEAGTYVAVDDYAMAEGFDFALITVPTPLRDGLPDLSFIELSAAALAPHIKPGSTVILESTTYPGTTEELLIPILENGSGFSAGTDFHVGYSPERIDPGNPVWRLENTPKVIAGIDEASLRKLDEFYGAIVEKTIALTSPKEAELTKLLENTFRHVNIALVNELAVFAHELGIDIHEAIDAASTKPFGYMRFTPGPGVGGHCLPVDPSYLSWQVKQRLGRPFRFVELANDVNDHMPNHVVSRVVAALNGDRKSVNGSTVLVLGMAYKKNTGDIRESPALRVVELLDELCAEIKVVDSYCDPSTIPDYCEQVELSSFDLSSVDIVLVLTEHDDVDYQEVVDSAVPIIDTRRVCFGSNVEYL